MLGRRPTGRMNRGRVQDGAAAWAPVNLSGLVLWLRADRGVTLNGSNVSGWADQSGLGDAARNADQGTAARQPAFNAANASYGNRPTIDFTAANTHYLVNSGAWSASYASPYTVGVVGHTTASPAGAFAAASGDYNDLMTSTPANDKTRHVTGAAGANVVYTSRESITAGISVAVVAGASSKMYVRSKTAAQSLAGTPAGTMGAVAMNVGRRVIGSAQYWNGPIAEVFVWSRALSNDEMGIVMDYAVARYGITLS